MKRIVTGVTVQCEGGGHTMNYFEFWLNADEDFKYSEWTAFVTDTGSDMTYSAFCDQIDVWAMAMSNV